MLVTSYRYVELSTELLIFNNNFVLPKSTHMRNVLFTKHTRMATETVAFMLNVSELYEIKLEYLTGGHSPLHYECDELTRSKKMYTLTLNFVWKSFSHTLCEKLASLLVSQSSKTELHY